MVFARSIFTGVFSLLLCAPAFAQQVAAAKKTIAVWNVGLELDIGDCDENEVTYLRNKETLSGNISFYVAKNGKIEASGLPGRSKYVGSIKGRKFVGTIEGGSSGRIKSKEILTISRFKARQSDVTIKGTALVNGVRCSYEYFGPGAQ
jgi:hypothetical protein